MQSLRSIISTPVVRKTVCKRFIQTSSSFNMPIKVGDKLPSIDLFDGTPGDKVNTEVMQKGKVVIFGVPGAFTPTCSNDHVPGFLNNVDKIKAKGVDGIYCVSVNDPFVMKAWGKSLDPSGKISFLADTGAALAKALDLEFDATPLLGNVRIKRFSLVAEDGIVKDIQVEPDGAGLSCSSGAKLLEAL